MPHTNAAGLALVKRFEGCELTAYQDSGGVWTVGYGHTGADVRAGETITQATAEKLLRDDLVRAEEVVSDCVAITLSPNEFAALVSFEYNTGALASSTLLRFVNEHNIAAAADEFLKWVHVNESVLPGLVRRRTAERALFLLAASKGRVA